MARQSLTNWPGVGGRVVALRTKSGLTQEALAEKLGISRSALNLKEHGDRAFSLEEMIQLSDQFDITIDEMIRGVKTANVDIHRETGLTDEAIEVLKGFSVEEPDLMDPLCKALSSYSVLDALARYMAHTAKKKGYYISDTVRRKGSFIDCTMSEELFENVLGQNLLHVLDRVKTGDRSSDYFSALEDFERYSDERKLAEPTDYEGAGDHAKKEKNQEF